MGNQEKLKFIRNHFFDKSEKLWWWCFILPVSAQMLLLISSVVNIHHFTVIAVFIAVTVPVGSRWLRYFALKYAAKGDRVRRMIFYSDSLGTPISQKELHTVNAWGIGQNIPEPEHIYGEFASTKQPGLNRLADNTVENAFFTYNLAEKMKSYLLMILIPFIVIFLVIIYFALVYGSGSVTTAKFVLVLASFLLGGDLTFFIIQYGSLHDEAKKAFDKASALRNKDLISLNEILFTVEDYNVALIKGPPIPHKLVYLKHVEQLNEIYKREHT